jgi:predicted  nucleic acid-binding Zn-ribbon protein
MKACPQCGCETFKYQDPAVLVFIGTFGSDDIECSETLHRTNDPIYCRCEDCGKRFKIADAKRKDTL